MLKINHDSYYEVVNASSGDFSFIGDESFGGWSGRLTFTSYDDAYCHASVSWRENHCTDNSMVLRS